jgi:hypothetical protein
MARGLFCRTSKMSHDGSWRAACSITIHFRCLHFETPSVARGVTDPDVGSGALLGRMVGLEMELFCIGLTQGRRSTRAIKTLKRLTRDAEEPGHRVRSRCLRSERQNHEAPPYAWCPLTRSFRPARHSLNLTLLTRAEEERILPNVKDEPRRELARRVPQSELDSDSSFRNSFGRTRRASSRRWLWRLVRRLGSLNWDRSKTATLIMATIQIAPRSDAIDASPTNRNQSRCLLYHRVWASAPEKIKGASNRSKAE